MARYTDTQTKAFNNLREKRVITVSGEVALEVWDGVAFVTDSSSPLLTDAHIVTTRGLQIRFTPTGGSSYDIEEGEYQ